MLNGYPLKKFLLAGKHKNLFYKILKGVLSNGTHVNYIKHTDILTCLTLQNITW